MHQLQYAFGAGIHHPFQIDQGKKGLQLPEKNPGTVILDVRTKAEFEGKADPNFGSLQNAINIPVQELSSRIGEIASLKDKKIIVYCARSHRSPQASYMLGQQGFTNIINMAGGISEMKEGKCKK